MSFNEFGHLELPNELCIDDRKATQFKRSPVDNGFVEITRSGSIHQYHSTEHPGRFKYIIATGMKIRQVRVKIIDDADENFPSDLDGFYTNGPPHEFVIIEPSSEDEVQDQLASPCSPQVSDTPLSPVSAGHGDVPERNMDCSQHLPNDCTRGPASDVAGIAHEGAQSLEEGTSNKSDDEKVNANISDDDDLELSYRRELQEIAASERAASDAYIVTLNGVMETQARVDAAADAIIANASAQTAQARRSRKRTARMSTGGPSRSKKGKTRAD